MARRPKIDTTTTTQATPEETKDEGASGEQTKAGAWPRTLECPHCKMRQLSSAALDLSIGTKKCIKCGAALSRLNEALPQQAEVPKMQEPPPRTDEPKPGGGSRATHPARSTSDAAAPNPEDVGETVSATWGEELYSPQQFFTFRVGPFMRSTKIREGETALTAKRRIHAELKQMADDERSEKMKIFIDAMNDLFAHVKGGR